VMPVTISVLLYYVSVRSELRIVMPVSISVLFYYVSVRSEFHIVMPVRTTQKSCGHHNTEFRTYRHIIEQHRNRNGHHNTELRTYRHIIEEHKNQQIILGHKSKPRIKIKNCSDFQQLSTIIIFFKIYFHISFFLVFPLSFCYVVFVSRFFLYL
jgi:hypothetical protein